MPLIKINSKYVTIRTFRDDMHALESVMQYGNDVILPILSAMPSAVTIRCCYSGIPIGYITAAELHDCMKAAIVDTKFTRFDALGYRFTEYDLINSVEAIIDQVEIKMILLRPKSPSFSYVHGQSVKFVASPAKQLCMLLNQFLFDPAHVTHNHYQNSDEEIAEARNLASMADEILEYFQLDSEIAQITLENLIELDAKYRINKLQLTNAEHAELVKIKTMAGTVNTEDLLTAIADLTMSMITWRDEKQTGLFVGRVEWTNTAYRMTELERTSRRRSNVISDDPKPKTPKEREKEKKDAVMRDLIFSVFTQKV